ncbi:MAG: cyclic nucleotide-binding domain-containing protein [Myxococcota bacterium]|nr:cyclic nucleotide-binding domain-containing protein [Myxococcota bacterium]
MLSIKGVPDELENIYTQYKDLSEAIYRSVKRHAKPQRLPANTDLFKCTAPGAVVFILEGYFKLNHNQKTVRMYSGSDFVTLANNACGFSLSSEFRAEIVVFEGRALMNQLRKDARLLESWHLLTDLDSKINLALGASYLSDDVKATFHLREVADGETIIKQGDPPDEVFELLQGKAAVFSADRHVGTVLSGEIFGEIGFLNDTARTATVIANGRCLVRVVKKEDFFALIKSNPELGIHISKTLASRVAALNDRLISHADNHQQI